VFLVIGGTGTVGGEVLRQLVSRGERVRALVRDPFRASRLARPGVELVQGDLARPDTLPATLAGVRRVFLVTTSGPDTVPLQEALIGAAAAAGVERLVRVSVLGIGSGIPAGLFAWHERVEATLAASGIPCVNLRPTSYMQNILAQAEPIRRAGQFHGAQGDGRVAFVDARDVAAAAVGALTREDHVSGPVALTGPEALSYADVAAELAAGLGRPVAYVDLPADAYRQGLLGAGLPEWLAADLALIEESGRGTVMTVTDGVERLAGRPPRRLAEFIRDHRALLA